MIRSRRAALAAAALVVSVVALTACANQTAGSAATLDDTRITDQALTTQVQDILEAKGQPVTSPDASLVQQTLGRMITREIVDRLAEQEGVVITQGKIDEQIANYQGQLGGQAQLENAFVQENVAPSQIAAFIRLQVQAQELGIALDPTGSAEEQGQAVFEAASQLSQELDTTVSPRYGTWDPTTLSLGPTPNDLSVEPTLG